MKYLLLTSCVIFLFIGAMAQDIEKKEKLNKHNIGAFIGGSSGYGLTYRFFSEKVGAQITAFPMYSTNSTHLSIGGEILYSFFRSGKVNMYGYLGYHYNVQDSDEEYDYYEIISPFNNGSSYLKSEVNYGSATGLGVGFELIANNRISFNWQIGYGYFILNTIDETLWKTSIDGGFGLFFKF